MSLRGQSARSAAKPESPPIKPQKLPAVLSSTTIQKPSFVYFHLRLLSVTSTTNSSDYEVDELTARTHLTSALNQFLGIYGTAVPVDILKCEGPNVWIRVPREDSSATTEALSGWIGKTEVAWQIKASGTWLGGLSSGDGRDLFN